MPATPFGKSAPEMTGGAPAWFRPVWLLDLELSRPLPDLPPTLDQHGQRYERAQILLRRYDRPLGTVTLDLPAAGLTAPELGAAIEKAVATDPGLAAPGAGELEADVAARDAFLARAPFASVVIATRNRPDNLARCLDSLAGLTYPDFETIVVDNAPSDERTARFFAERYGEQPNIRYVREDRPGLASAHNRGLRAMRPDSRFVAFTDDDVVVDRYWLCELIRGFEAAEHVGCVTGMIYPAELETWPQLLIEQFGGFNKGFRRQLYDLRRHRPDDGLFPFSPGRFGSGANMAFRSEALARIGGFDPAIGTGTPALGGDDLAAFFRIITEGYTLVYEPAAIVRHTHYRDYDALHRQIHGYGVGLTAFFTKALLDQPWLALDLASKLPRGVWYALSANSGKNRKKGIDYPEALSRLEWKGMLYGPIAYTRSKLAARTYERRAAPNEGGPE